MAYNKNILKFPQSVSWTLVNTTISDNNISLGTNGSATTLITASQLFNILPDELLVEVESDNPTSSSNPDAFMELVIYYKHDQITTISIPIVDLGKHSIRRVVELTLNDDAVNETDNNGNEINPFQSMRVTLRSFRPMNITKWSIRPKGKAIVMGEDVSKDKDGNLEFNDGIGDGGMGGTGGIGAINSAMLKLGLDANKDKDYVDREMSVFYMNTLEGPKIPVLMTRPGIFIDDIDTTDFVVEGGDYPVNMYGYAGPEVMEHWLAASEAELYDLFNDISLGYSIKDNGVLTLPGSEFNVEVSIDPVAGSVQGRDFQLKPNGKYTITNPDFPSVEPYGTDYREGVLFRADTMDPTELKEELMYLAMDVMSQVSYVIDFPADLDQRDRDGRVQILIRDERGDMKVITLAYISALIVVDNYSDFSGKMLISTKYGSIDGSIKDSFWREQTGYIPMDPDERNGFYFATDTQYLYVAVNNVWVRVKSEGGGSTPVDPELPIDPDLYYKVDDFSGGTEWEPKFGSTGNWKARPYYSVNSDIKNALSATYVANGPEGTVLSEQKFTFTIPDKLGLPPLTFQHLSDHPRNDMLFRVIIDGPRSSTTDFEGWSGSSEWRTFEAQLLPGKYTMKFQSIGSGGSGQQDIYVGMLKVPIGVQ